MTGTPVDPVTVEPPVDGAPEGAAPAAVPAPVVPGTPAPARSLTEEQRRAAAGTRESRMGFDDLPMNQQGIFGMLMALIQMFTGQGGNLMDGENPMISLMTTLTGLEPAEIQRRMDASRSSGETPSQAASRFDYPSDERTRGDATGDVLRLSRNSAFTGNETGIFLNRPVAANIPESSDFGMRTLNGRTRHHDGMDYDAPNNTPILAPADGRIMFAGPSSGYGNIVILDHGHGVYTLYGHLDNADIQQVRVGDTVEQGAVFAHTGSSGVGTGPHLHYEVLLARENGAPLNINPNGVREKDLADAEVQQDLARTTTANATSVAALQHTHSSPAGPAVA